MPDSNTIVELPNGQFGYQTTSADSREPIVRRWVWPLVNVRIEGMGGADKAKVVGREATCRDGQVSCYLGDGVYFRATMPQLGSTPAVIMDCAPVPRPKVRGGTEIRWNAGWQKYSKTQRSWLAA